MGGTFGLDEVERPRSIPAAIEQPEFGSGPFAGYFDFRVVIPDPVKDEYRTSFTAETDLPLGYEVVAVSPCYRRVSKKVEVPNPHGANYSQGTKTVEEYLPGAVQYLIAKRPSQMAIDLEQARFARDRIADDAVAATTALQKQREVAEAEVKAAVTRIAQLELALVTEQRLVKENIAAATKAEADAKEADKKRREVLKDLQAIREDIGANQFEKILKRREP